MKARNTSEKNNTKAKFIGLFAISLILCIAVTAAFWGPFPGSPSRQSTGLDTEAGFIGVRSGKQEAMGTDSDTSREQLNTSLVSDAEKSLRASIDSMHGSGHGNTKIQVDSTLNLFREAIKNPQSISVINDVLKNRHKAGAANSEEVVKLKDELLLKEGQLVSLQNQLKSASTPSGDLSRLKKDIQTKDAQIATLQNQLKTVPKETAGNSSVDKMKNDLETKDAQITKLMTQLKTRPNAGNSGSLMEENKKLVDENSFLKWAVRSEVSSNHNLTNLNSSLKQANTTLQNQVNDLKKNGN